MNASYAAQLGITAQNNLYTHLVTNPYPGRGIVAGLDETGEHLVQVYWLMGRSENSRNRVLSVLDGHVCTEAADPSKVKDPSLIIYTAMRSFLYSGHVPSHAVSNGKQTDDVAHYCFGRKSFFETMQNWPYEPDAPNFTPRITALSGWSYEKMVPRLAISVIRKSLAGTGCDRFLYEYEGLLRGLGYCVTTYNGDGDPLPSFDKAPLLMPLSGGIEEIAEKYWASLNEENRISLAVKFIPKEGDAIITLRNKRSKS